jgi:phenylalanyl-tRNA synthetase beta chain
MANIKISRNLFEKEIGKLDEEMQTKIAMFGTTLEGFDDNEIELEIFPNRPDLLSYQGFKRGFLGFLGKKTGLRDYKIKSSGEKLIVDKSLPKQWPYAFACIVKGLKFDDQKIKEVIDIQEKLGSTLLRKRKKGGIGLYPLEKINFPVKFKGMHPNEIKFVPLEAKAEMTGRQILSRHPTGRDYAHVCKDWDKFPIFIDNSGKIMSMPPIINSHLMGKIDQTTTEVFVESTGNDFNTVLKALIIIVTALGDMGGKIYSIDCIQQNGKKAPVPDLTPEKMRLTIENCKKLLGIDLKEKQVIGLLEKMGYNAKKIKQGIEANVPAWRTDVLHEHDLIEDVAIAYGYDKFIPELPKISTVGEEDSKEIKKRKISQILVGLKMLEVNNYHLTTVNDQFKNLSIKKDRLIEVEESKSEYSLLRQDLLHYLLKIFRQNVDSEYPQKIFELGRVFELDSEGKTETGIIEKENLSIAIADPKTGFTEIKQILDLVMRQLDIEYKLEESESPYFIIGRCAKLIVGDKEVGHIGEIHPRILNNLKIKMPVSALEICLDSLF